METTRYAEIGKCIYCGSSEELGNEHIVPLSLWGQWVLPKASCRQCEKVTSAFEGKVAHNFFEPLRLKLDAPTRNPKKRPTHLKMLSDNEEEVLVPAKESLGGVIFPAFAPPGFLRNPPERPKTWLGVTLQYKSLKSNPTKWPQNAKQFATRPILLGKALDDYGRMVAKIAHAFCVAMLGVDSFEHWLVPYILGYDPHLAYLIGGIRPEWDKNTFFLPTSATWQLNWGIQDRPPGIPTEEMPRVPIVLAFMWFFSESGNSPYCAVVGRATDAFMASYKAKRATVD